MESEPMLAPYRVLDLTDEWGVLSGRLLADLGADVIKIEKTGGDPMRNIGPFFQDIPHPERSLFWDFYNAGKRSITLDIESADGRDIFKKLVKSADFVIESWRPGYLASLGLDYAALSEINPSIIMTSITPFGQTGPYSNYKSADVVNQALCGFMNKIGDPDRAPLQIGAAFQSNYHASAQAVAGILAALYYRWKTGEGQYVDATPLPWMAHFGAAPVRWFITRQNEGRNGQSWEPAAGRVIRYVWKCKDGHVSYSIMGGARFGQFQKALVDWMAEEGMAPDFLKEVDWDKLDPGPGGKEIRARSAVPIAEFFQRKTMAELFRESLKRRIALFPANTPKEIFEDSQLAFRNYWVEVDHPEMGTKITYPGPFFRSSETSWVLKRRAPLIGEHNEEIYVSELGFSKQDMITLKQANII